MSQRLFGILNISTIENVLISVCAHVNIMIMRNIKKKRDKMEWHITEGESVFIVALMKWYTQAGTIFLGCL